MADWSKVRVPELYAGLVVLFKLTCSRQATRKGFPVAKKHQEKEEHIVLNERKDFLHGPKLKYIWYVYLHATNGDFSNCDLS